MKITELKSLMGIADGDSSQDAMLSLYLDTAIEQLKAYATGYSFGSSPLTASMKLGIVKYVELSKKRTQGRIKSESLAGASVTYADLATNANYYDEAFAYWEMYRSQGLVFRPAIRTSSR